MINDIEVNSPTDLLQAYEELEKARTLNIQVMRRNKVHDLKVNIR